MSDRRSDLPEADPMRAAGTPEHPLDPGEYQAGDLGEQAQQRGGPVDIYPARKLPGMESPLATDEVGQLERSGEEPPDGAG